MKKNKVKKVPKCTIKKKPKLKSVKWLKTKLWELTSKYVRYSAIESDGLVQCVTCYRRLLPTEIHAGHFQPKKRGLNIYFDLRNIHPQCPQCNMFERGRLATYAVYMVKTYGEGILEELERASHETVKWHRSGFEERIEDLKNKLNEVSTQSE